MNALLKIAVLCSFSIYAWGSEAKLEKVAVDTGVPAIERGAETLMNACHSCHSMKYIKYRDLLVFGMDKKKVDEWRGDQSLDTPLMSQMSDADAMESFAKIPPDLSLMTKARDGGVNYVYSYLMGYYMTADGMPGNHIFPETKMPDPLGISSATDSAQRTEIEGQARDIVSFLSWAADPHQAERIRLGYYVIAYLFALTILLYFLKNQIWSRLK